MIRVIAIRCGLVIAFAFSLLILFSTSSVSFGAPPKSGPGRGFSEGLGGAGPLDDPCGTAR